MTPQQIDEFIQLLIMRGFGLYGDNKMMKICGESGLACRIDGSYEIKNKEELEETIEKLIINYAKFNLPAKMTAMVLAKKYNIPIPEELKASKKKKSKYRQKQYS